MSFVVSGAPMLAPHEFVVVESSEGSSDELLNEQLTVHISLKVSLPLASSYTRPISMGGLCQPTRAASACRCTCTRRASSRPL